MGCRSRLARWLVAVPTVFVGCSMGTSGGGRSESSADDGGTTIAEASAPDASLGADGAGGSGAKDGSSTDAAAGEASTEDTGTGEPPPAGAVAGGDSSMTFVSDFTKSPTPPTTPPVTSQSILIDSNMTDANDSEMAGFK